MKKFNINILKTLLVIMAGTLVFFACKEDEEIFPETRLFMPVLNEELYSMGNTIIVDMGKMKKAVSYTLEVSRDTFKTIDYVIESDTNYVEINEELVGEELLWYTIYQVRATAHAEDPEYDSKISVLGNVRTQKFPSNMGVPTFFDVTDKRARVFWTPIGAPITQVKVFAINDIRLENPLMEFTVDADDQLAAEKIISGLDPLTSYQVAIYSDGELRGWEVYNTKAPIVGDNIIDLSGLNSESILADTLGDIPNGSIVLLEAGKIYNADGYDFDKSVLIRSGYGFTPQLPLIQCGSNFNIVDGASVDSVVFQDVAFTGNFGGNYVFNIDKNGTIGEIKFDNCRIRSLRGITRIKGGTGTLQKFSIVNSVVDSINGYGILAVDTDGWHAGDILLKNSTFSRIIYFLISRSNTNSVTIESCTIDDAPEKGRQMFRWRGAAGNNDVINGIKIYNTIWGAGWNKAGDADVAVKGFQGLPATNFDIINTWSTSDFTFSGNPIPGFPSAVYSGTAEDLWVNPAEVNYNFKDTKFAGKGNSGDPRWRIGL